MPMGVTSQTKPTIDSKGSLRNSIRTAVKVQGSNVKAEIFSTHGLAKILHEGARITSHRDPFVFDVRGETVATYQIDIPGRPFIAAAVRNNGKKITKQLMRDMMASYKRAG